MESTMESILQNCQGRDSYDLLGRVGVASKKAKVFRARYSSFFVAVKIIDFSSARLYISGIMRYQHPNLLKPFCIFAVEQKSWIISPLIEPGSLVSLMDSKLLNESAVATVLSQVLEGIWFLHQNRCAHGGVKLGNILVDSSTKTIKLADFATNSSIYDPSYGGYWSCPEQTNDTFANDVWSFRITALEMVFGGPPVSVLPVSENELGRMMKRFGACDYKKILKERHKPITMCKNFWAMVGWCLQRDPTKRPTAEELRCHGFFTEKSSSEKFSLKPIRSIGYSWDFNPRMMQLECKQTGGEESESQADLPKKGILAKLRRGWNFTRFITICDQSITVAQKLLIVIGLSILLMRGSASLKDILGFGAA